MGVVTEFQRISQIAEILGRYGFGIAMERLIPQHGGVQLPARGKPPHTAPEYERLRLAIEELGPTFVKFGQILATRADILPAGLVNELKKLQDHVRPVPFAEVRDMISASCPVPGTCFRSIEEEPVASASIAQVHRAVLMDGTKVALKIQRPGIGEIIATDIRILQKMAERAERVFPDIRFANPSGMVRDFALQIERELDFLQEARTAERMRRNFAGVPGIRIPKIYREYSSPRLLVMEYVEGVRIDDLHGIEEMGLDRREIGRRGFHAYLRMIFGDGFYHGDPHPGNLLVTRDGTLVILDFGISGALRPEKREIFIHFLAALQNEDTELLMRSLEGMGVVIPAKSREQLQDDLFSLIHELDLAASISHFNFALFSSELAAVMRRHRITLPANLMLLLKVLVMTLDLGVRLDPDFSISRELSPYLAGIARKDLIAPARAQRAAIMFLEVIDAVLDLPRHLGLLLRRFSAGTFRIDVIDTDIVAFEDGLDEASDKIVIGFVIGSLVIGSSLVLRAAGGPLPPWISWLAIFGYGAAILAGFYVIYHIVYLDLRESG